MGNSERNKQKAKKNYFILALLFSAIVIFLAVIWLFFNINNGIPTVYINNNDCIETIAKLSDCSKTVANSNDSSNTLANLGTIGDYFGGLLNPLLGFVSFCALLYTIHIQREELGMTKKELSRNADAQEKSLAIVKQQQFESTFFSLLNQIVLKIDRFHESNIRKDNNGSYWHETMEFFSSVESLDTATKYMSVHDVRLSQIFSLIYQMLELINRYEDELSKYVNVSEQEDLKRAKNYSDILRSCLDENLLQLFAINGCRTDLNNMQMYKEYIERYVLLEHISFIFYKVKGDRANLKEMDGEAKPAKQVDKNSDESYLKEMVGVYSPKAFGENKEYKEIKKAFDLNEWNKRIDVARGLSEKDINDAKEIISR